MLQTMTAICVFDVPDADKDSVLDSVTAELKELAKNIDVEELETQAAGYENKEEGGKVDSTDGWVDKRLELTDIERAALDDSVLSVRLLLVKLRKLSYAIVNSTTLLLPKWFSTLKDMKLDERAMPCDVSTCWNLTYDMLKFAIDYRKAIDRLTTDKSLGI
ncbi:uncharacterized protein LACBIDRAFT_306234 [Laccaria bicolor S238N-H82]|uniref:Predicted protein n=1 Tax=Laccaria bicolor (strain S238N-H82 / ATCC MYA-4686) TaxID=486041 RepID=B0CT79_LACBS|nr:uncharacterized protein LACBIDRAFT_306234 [Laccaria bicolor S238N-H82]EDR14414.1 predicted protein [Laccaria bicolor S238N-H82]|eukprot:XP_001874973.1 predicted protein [Laccaria bicolor S238N-H82]